MKYPRNSILFLNFERILFWYEIKAYFKKNLFLSYFLLIVTLGTAVVTSASLNCGSYASSDYYQHLWTGHIACTITWNLNSETSLNFQIPHNSSVMLKSYMKWLYPKFWVLGPSPSHLRFEIWQLGNLWVTNRVIRFHSVRVAFLFDFSHFPARRCRVTRFVIGLNGPKSLGLNEIFRTASSDKRSLIFFFRFQIRDSNLEGGWKLNFLFPLFFFFFFWIIYS